MKNKIISAILAIIATMCFCACSEPDYSDSSSGKGDSFTEQAELNYGDRFLLSGERGYVNAQQEPTSAFSLTPDRAAYVYMRKCVQAGRLPAPEAVRAEEYINYFNYDVPVPEGENAGVYANVYPCPWNADSMLIRVTAATARQEISPAPRNLVFLVDTSASMYGDDRLGLFSAAIKTLAVNMRATDVISVITYGGGSTVLLDGVSGDERDEIIYAASRLTASGVTAGASAIQKAYTVARNHFIEGGDNRIILFTDGDFNVGVSSAEGLKTLIAQQAIGNLYFSCVGVGFGNYNDTSLQALAEAGNGNVYYCDGEAEAKRVFGEQLGGVLHTAVSDAKAQVEFNPSAVKSYRLIGYDNRRLSDVQFEDDGTNAGEMGSGTQATAVYEIIPAADFDAAQEAATVRIRGKFAPDTEVKEIVASVTAREPNSDDGFIACVTEFALLLRNSLYKGDASIDGLMRRLSSLELYGERSEFAAIVSDCARLF